MVSGDVDALDELKVATPNESATTAAKHSARDAKNDGLPRGQTTPRVRSASERRGDEDFVPMARKYCKRTVLPDFGHGLRLDAWTAVHGTPSRERRYVVRALRP
jgi:hypothetical protein